MSKSTVNVVCAKAPRRIGCVPAVRYRETISPVNAGRSVHAGDLFPRERDVWLCSFCGARVKVVA